MSDKIQTYMFFGLFVIVGVISLFIIYPFFKALLTAAALVYVFFPIFRKLNKKIRNKYLCSAIVTLALLLVITIPLLFAINALSKEAYVIYIQANQKITQGTLFECDGTSGLLCRLAEMSTNVRVIYYTQQALKGARDFLVKYATDFVIQTPTKMLHVFVTIFTMFYLFVDGPRLVRRMSELIPFKKSHAASIRNKIKDVVYSVIYGNVLIAFVQAIVAFIGFWIFGIASPLIWGVVTFFFGFVPFIGTAFVWLPLSIGTFINGITIGSNKIIWNGIGLLVYGALLISTIDNLIKPKVLSTTTRIHPVLVLVGVLGGLAVFGFIGFILGPLILALLNTFLKIYVSEFK